MRTGRIRELNRKIRKADREAQKLYNARTFARIQLGAQVAESTEDAVKRLLNERRRIDAKLRGARLALVGAV